MHLLRGTPLHDYDDDDDNLHNQLFSSRENVQEVLRKECKLNGRGRGAFLLVLFSFWTVLNHQQSMTESIAHILLPQMNDDLEEAIRDAISSKSLTERHLAMAPMVSYR